MQSVKRIVDVKGRMLELRLPTRLLSPSSVIALTSSRFFAFEVTEVSQFGDVLTLSTVLDHSQNH